MIGAIRDGNRPRLSIGLALLSALLFALALPNEFFVENPFFMANSWILGILAPVPLYLALASAPNWGRAFALSSLFGATSHALTSYWLFFYKNFAFWTLGTTTLAYGIIYGVAGLYGYFALKSAKPHVRPFHFALAWVSLEYLKSSGFLGYPWGLLPYSMSARHLFLQIADITGVYGLSWILAISGALAAEIILYSPTRRFGILPGFASLSGFPAPMPAKAMRRSSAFVLCAWIGLLLYGVASMKMEIPLTASFSALLVQQNTDPWIAGELSALRSNIELASSTLEDAKAHGKPSPDLIIFSETSLSRPYAEYRSWFSAHPAEKPLLPFIKESGSFLLTGAPVVRNWDKWEVSNSVLLISPEGELLENYAKMHPVPFAEAIPLWEFSWFREFMQKVVGLEGGWVMGKEQVVFSIEPKAQGRSLNQEVRFGAPICFEDAFAPLCRDFIRSGADILINLTNDSWSKQRSAQYQHWAIARFRAIENRRTLVRSTNSGVSCVVDPWGRNILELDQFRPKAAIFDVPVYKTETPSIYTACGDWFAIFCLALFCRIMIVNAFLARATLTAQRSSTPLELELVPAQEDQEG